MRALCSRQLGFIFRQVGDVVESGGSVKNARGEFKRMRVGSRRGVELLL